MPLALRIEFAKALAAGFDLPRVLDQFLDGVGELVRPSRAAILLAGPESHLYEKTSLIITTNLSFGEWVQVLGRIRSARGTSHRTKNAQRERGKEPSRHWPNA